MTLEAIRYRPGSLQILNQLLLPHQSVHEEIRSVQDAYEAIRSMKVRSVSQCHSVPLDRSHRCTVKSMNSRKPLLVFISNSHFWVNVGCLCLNRCAGSVFVWALSIRECFSIDLPSVSFAWLLWCSSIYTFFTVSDLYADVCLHVCVSLWLPTCSLHTIMEIKCVDLSYFHINEKSVLPNRAVGSKIG